MRDPAFDYEDFQNELEEEIEKRPVCNMCGSPILTEKAVYYNDQWICEDCEPDAWDVIRKDYLEEVS